MTAVRTCATTRKSSARNDATGNGLMRNDLIRSAAAGGLYAVAIAAAGFGVCQATGLLATTTAPALHASVFTDKLPKFNVPEFASTKADGPYAKSRDEAFRQIAMTGASD